MAVASREIREEEPRKAAIVTRAALAKQQPTIVRGLALGLWGVSLSGTLLFGGGGLGPWLTLPPTGGESGLRWPPRWSVPPFSGFGAARNGAYTTWEHWRSLLAAPFMSRSAGMMRNIKSPSALPARKWKGKGTRKRHSEGRMDLSISRKMLHRHNWMTQPATAWFAPLRPSTGADISCRGRYRQSSRRSSG